MKRHDSIVALSREHHFGLLFCWKIRQGIKKQVSAARMRPYIKYFWQQHLEQHFSEVENLLFSLVNDDLTEQAIMEHKRIKQLVEAIVHAADASSIELNTLANTVDDHIRFEERKLFPHIEQQLSDKELAELGLRLQQLHATPEKDDYVDEFWL
jgi:hemerythrin-like domain-containing protein